MLVLDAGRSNVTKLAKTPKISSRHRLGHAARADDADSAHLCHDLSSVDQRGNPSGTRRCMMRITDPDDAQSRLNHWFYYVDQWSICQVPLCELTPKKITATCLKSRATSSASTVQMPPCETSPAGRASGWPRCFVTSRRGRPSLKHCCARAWMRLPGGQANSKRRLRQATRSHRGLVNGWHSPRAIGTPSL